MSKRRRIVIITTAGTVAVLLVAVGALAVLNRPLSADEVNQAIVTQLQEVVDDNDGVSSVLLTIATGPTEDPHQFAVGTTHPNSAEAASVDSPFHSASVGKTMLATVFGQLVDEDIVTFDSAISDWLTADTLEGLFVVDGVDHSTDVTLDQLLSHTSGVNDYFEGPVTSGATMLERIAADPDHLFTPDELVAFTRDRQKPVGIPGETFAYSDTGYVLLGLSLEAIEGKPYAQILDERIFEPLGMTDSYLMTEFGSPTGILSLDAFGVDLSARNALSVDWAGGGVVTTTTDLLIFMRALEGDGLVSKSVHARMTDFSQELESGIGYGMGMMQFRFSELSPLLFWMSDMHGAVGATGAFALYDPSSDTYYIAHFGSLSFARKAIEELVDIRLTFDRLEA